MAGLQDKIKHIVVLMLENRSFDCILGRLYPSDDTFNGVPEGWSNPWTGGTTPTVLAWNDEGAVKPGDMTIPSPDPGELFADINTQLFGLGSADNGLPPPMNGFVDNYVRQTEEPPYDARQVMHYFTPKQVPVISQLATQFAVCDQWHASAPNQTWPNRFFTHCATAGGYVNNSPPHFPYMMPTIFNRIDQSSVPGGWKIYFHDVPQSLSLSHLWLHRDGFKPFDDFIADAKAGNLPAYAFIEPRYFADLGLGMPNDQHPPHDVVFAEQLIANVYNALHESANWSSTLFIITYDEHGGCFDHAPPPRAVPPGDHRPHDDFAFDRYGVRVPAVIISPYISPGTKLRAAPKGLPHQGPPYPFDHTSIIATVRKCFDLGGPMTARDAAAPDLEQVLTLPEPSNNGPDRIDPPNYTPSKEDLQNAIGRPLTDMQLALHALSAVLPAPGADIETHIANLAAGLPVTSPVEAVRNFMAAEAAKIV
jgi:phospholipase C